jgi:hypothetical protein
MTDFLMGYNLVQLEEFFKQGLVSERELRTELFARCVGVDEIEQTIWRLKQELQATG